MVARRCNSLHVAIASTMALTVLLALPAAYALARFRTKFRGRGAGLGPAQPGVPVHPA